MSNVLNVFVEKMKNNKVITFSVAVMAVAVLALASYFVNNGMADAGYERVATTELAGLSGAQKELTITGTHVIKGDSRRTYTDIHITASNNSVIILENVKVKLTTDKPFITCNGTGDGLEYTIILAGDSTIESTYAGAKMPIIGLEGYEIRGEKPDPIFGSTIKTYSSRKILTITDEYEGEKYYGSLTLINAEETTSSVIGTVSSDLVTPPGSSAGWYYEYIFYGCGDVHIEGTPQINIVNKGIGAGIGGGGVLNGDPTKLTEALGGGKTFIKGGTTRIILPANSYGTAIGGGSAMKNLSGTMEPDITIFGGQGADVQVTGGSLFVENLGHGGNFGCGLGVIDESVYKGSLKDDLGNPLDMYTAEIAKDEATQPSGRFDVYNDLEDNYGEFDLTGALDSEEYTYKVMNAVYDDDILGATLYKLKSLTTVDTYYNYEGIGYESELYDLSGNKIDTEDVSDRLFFYLPSTPAVEYDIEIDSITAQNVNVTTFKGENPINSARRDTRVIVKLEYDSILTLKRVYYMKDGSPSEYPLDYEDDVYSFEMPEANVTIFVETEVPVYNITYMNTLGGSHSNPGTYKPGDEFTFKAPSVVGNVFKGWEDEAGNPVAGITKDMRGDIIVFATWETLIYTVTFKDFDESIIYSETVNHGQSATAPSRPTRDGYTFTGWDKKFDNVTENMVIYAQYEKNTVTDTPILPPAPTGPFNINIAPDIANGSVTASVTQATEGTGVTLKVKAAAGYRLQNVKVVKSDGTVTVNQLQILGGNPDVTGEYEYLFTMPAANVTVYAEFVISQYTITYVNVGNNDHGNPTSYNKTDAFKLNNPTKDGVKFLGWEDAEGNIITEITAGTTGNLVLVGKWENSIVTTKNKIHINRGIKNGVIVSSHSLADAGEIITITATAEQGYRLKSIKYVLTGDLTAVSTVIENPTADGNEITFEMPAEDIIVTAEFEAIKYNIIYVDVDSHDNPTSYIYGESFQFKTPVKEGYIFDKWYDINGDEITGIPKNSSGNVIVIATWKKAPSTQSVYSITVDDNIENGAVYVDKNIALAGDEVNVSVEAENGYKLGRLEFVPEAADLVMNDSRNKLYLGGSSAMQSMVVSRGAGDNYVFTMPASNILVKASFVALNGGSYEPPTTRPEPPTTAPIVPPTTPVVPETPTTTKPGGGSAGETTTARPDIDGPTTEPNTEEVSTEEPTGETQTTEKEPSALGPEDNDINNVGDGNIKTGDESKPVLYIFVAIFALVAMIAAFFYKEKETEDYEH